MLSAAEISTDRVTRSQEYSRERFGRSDSHLTNFFWRHYVAVSSHTFTDLINGTMPSTLGVVNGATTTTNGTKTSNGINGTNGAKTSNGDSKLLFDSIPEAIEAFSTFFFPSPLTGDL